ncbi:MAG: GTPase ObgE [Phycisphaerales bacterium]|nr:GTPase ObgE [Phycisphaerales bacterium]
MFVDSAEIYVRAGRGGHGCMSFRREKYVPRGGPDGGDGGNGGHVFLLASEGVETLLDFSGKHHWIAENGAPGAGKNCTGRSGEDLIIRLPPGTLVYDRDTGVQLIDLKEVGQQVCIAVAGRGGKGNRKFATPTHRAPREAEEGQPGQERWLRLELKLIADVGLVGLPNAGKSTLLSRLSRATPKIADYPFTTLSPQLGIVELSDHRRFVLADIPGLIEGAHEGAGLGDAFLRHIERTRVMVHMIDVGTDIGGPSAVETYHLIRRELEAYSTVLGRKRELIVANKIDLTGGEEAARALAEALGREVFAISAATGRQSQALKERIWRLLEEARAEEAETPRDEVNAPGGDPVRAGDSLEDAPAPGAESLAPSQCGDAGRGASDAACLLSHARPARNWVTSGPGSLTLTPSAGRREVEARDRIRSHARRPT